MKCPKCGLVIDDQHIAEYYVGCNRCSAILRWRKYGPAWRLEEGKIVPLINDRFCQQCGRLLKPFILSDYCTTCEKNQRGYVNK